MYGVEIFNDFVMDENEFASDDLFVADCRFASAVGNYVVDILYEYNGRVDVVEVFDECAVTARTEYKSAVVITEKAVVDSCCDSIGRWFLF